ncbi:hypothetical protein IAT38_004216 [Cryptococcus sp. DSM 104549]
MPPAPSHRFPRAARTTRRTVSHTPSTTSASSSPYAETARLTRSTSETATPSSSLTTTTATQTFDPAIYRELGGLQCPDTTPWVGGYPLAYIDQLPVPQGTDPKQKAHTRPSVNPWDYLLEVDHPKGQVLHAPEGWTGERVSRNVMTRENQQLLEALWSVDMGMPMVERQRAGAWMGMRTRYITNWFQNRRAAISRLPENEQGSPAHPLFKPATGFEDLVCPTKAMAKAARSIAKGHLTRETYLAGLAAASAGLGAEDPSRSTRLQKPLARRASSNAASSVSKDKVILRIKPPTSPTDPIQEHSSPAAGKPSLKRPAEDDGATDTPLPPTKRPRTGAGSISTGSPVQLAQSKPTRRTANPPPPKRVPRALTPPPPTSPINNAPTATPLAIASPPEELPATPTPRQDGEQREYDGMCSAVAFPIGGVPARLRAGTTERDEAVLAAAEILMSFKSVFWRRLLDTEGRESQMNNGEKWNGKKGGRAGL